MGLLRKITARYLAGSRCVTACRASRRVVRGTFSAVVAVHNPTSEPGADLTVDLDGSEELDLFDGISVLQTDPPYVSHWEASPGRHFYAFDLTVTPGETAEVSFELRADSPGDFRGLLFVDVTTSADRLHTPATLIEIAVLA